MTRTYYCWAEHTAGKSISHHCSSGTFTDPVDDWELEIEAENEDAAIKTAAKQFEESAREWENENQERCACGRYGGCLWNSWWDSQCVTASRTPYPNYTGDEDED